MRVHKNWLPNWFRLGHLKKGARLALVATLLAGGFVLAGPRSSAVAAEACPSVEACYNNVGITADNNTDPGNFDGTGSSFSADALSKVGATPGSTIVSSGMKFTFRGHPSGADEPADKPDNLVAQGQKINVSSPGTTLGFLLSASYGPVSGTGTITYTDGDTQSYTLNSADWWTPCPSSGSRLAIHADYQNLPDNTKNRHPDASANIFSVTVPLDPDKTIESVTLPPGANRATAGRHQRPAHLRHRDQRHDQDQRPGRPDF
ncbi:hypothetical protein ACIBKX_40445 [Streptomyces sp. NPDC050658]|uniref:hypothetical protein n=1 Tax=unclassified Streptomyces TaxID=2593676 RepID=UPI00341E83A7